MFKPEEIPWEIWTIKIEQMQLSSENGREKKDQISNRGDRQLF